MIDSVVHNKLDLGDKESIRRELLKTVGKKTNIKIEGKKKKKVSEMCNLLGIGVIGKKKVEEEEEKESSDDSVDRQ